MSRRHLKYGKYWLCVGVFLGPFGSTRRLPSARAAPTLHSPSISMPKRLTQVESFEASSTVTIYHDSKCVGRYSAAALRVWNRWAGDLAPLPRLMRVRIHV